MKRNHIYIGGTVLLALLGACGGYYLWAGSGEEKDKGQAKSDDGADTGDDDAESILPIDVPPMTPDEAYAVPVMPQENEPRARYAMNPANLDSGAGQTPYPAAGGASPLPAGQGAFASDALTRAQARADTAGQTDPQSGRYGAYSAPLGNPLEGASVVDETAEPLRAAAEPNDRTDPVGQPGATDAISRGQDDPAGTDISDLGNSLRSSARSAFGSDTEGTAIAGDADGYRAAAIGYGAIGTATQQASPPAPIQVADAAEPLYRSSAPPLPLGNGEQPSPAGPGVVAESPFTSAAGGVEGGESGFADSADGALAAGSARSQDTTYGGGYSGASDIGSSTLGSTGVGSYGSASAADSYASNSPQSSPRQQFNESSVGVPRAMNSFDAVGSAQNAGIAASPIAGGTAGQFADGAGGTGRPGGEALEGPQVPQLTVEKSAPVEIQVGKNCTFTIEVKNTGRAEARQVRLVDEVPHGTQLVRTSPNAAIAGSQLEWEFGTLAAGESKSVEVELMPTDEGEIGSVATVHFAASASVRTHSTRPQLEVVAEVSPTVMIGEQQVVRISLKNPGTGDATGVMLLENVPDGLSHPHGPDLEFEVGTLRAGESRQLELVLTAEAKGVFANRIVAKGDGDLLYAEDVAQFEVIAPEIAVSVAGPQKKYLELPATFVVAVENTGTAAAKDIELVGKLPPGLQFVSANNFGEYDEATRSVYWSLAELQPSKKGEVTLVAMPVDLGEQRLEFKAGADLGLVDHTESTLQVEGLAALKSEVTDVADPIEVGGHSSYEIRIVNQGSKPATNVRVIAQFPEGIEAVRAEGPTEGRVTPKLVEFAPLKELSPKADTTYRIEVKGVRPGDQRVLVQIMTNDLAQPINEEESTRVYADQ